jgi:hypothetical protein
MIGTSAANSSQLPTLSEEPAGEWVVSQHAADLPGGDAGGIAFGWGSGSLASAQLEEMHGAG